MQLIPRLTAQQTKVLNQLGKDTSDSGDCEMSVKVLEELQELNLVVISGGRFVVTKRGEKLLAEIADVSSIELL